MTKKGGRGCLFALHLQCRRAMELLSVFTFPHVGYGQLQRYTNKQPYHSSRNNSFVFVDIFEVK